MGEGIGGAGMNSPIVFPDADSMGLALAREIVTGIEEAHTAGRRYLLGCPGGRSPRTTYAALARLVAERRMDLSHLVIVMMDDYVALDGDSYRRVNPDLHCSVEGFALREIVGPLDQAAPLGSGIAPEHLWMPDPSDPASYDARLSDAGGVDLFILASGDSDGHVAFNPPGSARDSRTRIVELADSTRRDNLGTFPEFDSLDAVPRYGISVGVGTIVEVSRRAVLVAPGPSKVDAVQRIADAAGYDPQWPATLLVCCRDHSLYADSLSAPSNRRDHVPDGAPTGRNEVHS
jgi:glucosamine-6-phosphate deaminase